MGLKKLPYKTIDELIRKNLAEEDAKTAVLIRQLGAARKRGWLTKEELELICRWKSPRAIHHIRSNHAGTIKSITRAALQTKDEHVKMELLTTLSGVSIPMASAVLTLLYPSKYGVIDIRVWQVLYQLKVMTTNKRGTLFRKKEWIELLLLLRVLSKKFGTSVRIIEYTLFVTHQRHQKGTLYSNNYKQNL